MTQTQQLLARLPELKWHLNETNPVIWQHALPPGLFRQNSYFSSSAVISELQDDILTIERLHDGESRRYKIKKIEQKIHVLVTLSRLQNKHKKNTKTPQTKLLDKICKRGEWVMKLEQEIVELTAQKQALQHQLDKPKNTDLSLALRQQIGKIEELITKNQDALARL